MEPRIDDVLAVWFGGDDEPVAQRQARWFTRDPAFDDELRRRFADLVAAAGRGELDGWAATPRGALALVVVLDQLPRNLHRGAAAAFAHDQRALATCRAALARGDDRALSWLERYMLRMPLMHAEDREVQRESVASFEALHAEAVAAGAPAEVIAALAGAADYARRHAVIVERFGRYPHRNAVLERTSTGDELEFLTEPGSSF
ncbi:MAG: DUF924 domain-containing protein [Kofleriaceae bacterium]|nr:DUF924 domain-containing protein [Kofleriaceae bacterium]MCL4226511.1 DUF924 family protein [Myxococcales bacterium]